jgi:D-sedoheptulose 7-phosphate isomerase
MSQTLDIKGFWKQTLTEAQNTLDAFMAQPEIWARLEKLTVIITDTYKKGGTVFICGNGGSYCDAMYFAEEWTGRYRKNRKPMGALALGDASHLTCVSNDMGFEYVFERQITALGRPGDCLLLISTSGNSQNQLLAAAAAKAKGLKSAKIF